jgi:hypothetical protein
MIAWMLVAILLIPLGGVEVKAEEVPYSLAKEAQVIANGTLEKGDKFAIHLYLKKTTGEWDTTEVRKLTVVGIEGSASASNASYDYSRHDSDALIKITDLVYTGKGQQVDVYIRYGGFYDDKPITVSLPKVEETKKAGLAVEVGNNNIINVVAGETQQIRLTLTNNSGYRSEAGKMKLEIKQKNTTAKNIKLVTTTYDIPEMYKGESRTYNITLSIDENVTRGIHELEVDIEGAKHIVQLKVDSNYMPAALELTTSGTEGFKVNSPKDVVINLKNIGNIAAKNVKLELTQNEKVYVLGGSNIRYLDNIEIGKTGATSVRLQISDLSATVVPLQLKLSYTDDLGKVQEDNHVIYLNTQGALLNKEVEILNIIEPTGKKVPNEEFELKFSLFAKEGAKNVKVSVNGQEGIVPKTKNLFILPELQPGQKDQYSVTFMATEAAKTSSYPIEIKATYTLGSEEIVMSQYGSVFISNPEKEDDDEAKKGTPKVIVGEYKSDPVVVKAGEEFDLQIGFLNTNSTKRVSNLKANLTIREEVSTNSNSSGSVFTPVGASNTFYIEGLSPGQTEVKNIRLYTLPSAAPKTYEITIEMEYEDDEGNEVKATERIGIPVEQTTKLEIGEVQMDMLEVGRTGALNATIYNTGKTDISNVMIRLEGEGFSVEDNKLFIGKFNQGDVQYYNPMIIPMQGGILQATMIVEYEDATGALQTITHEIEMEVMEMPIFDPGDDMWMDPVEPQTPSKIPSIVGVLIGFLVAAGVTFVIVRKKEKKLDEMMFDED